MLMFSEFWTVKTTSRKTKLEVIILNWCSKNMTMLLAIKRLDSSPEHLAEARDPQTENKLTMIEIAGTNYNKYVVILLDWVENFKF